MKIAQTFEEKLIERLAKSSEIVKQKYFKQFCQCSTDIERNNIGAKMDVIDAVIYDMNKALKGR